MSWPLKQIKEELSDTQASWSLPKRVWLRYHWIMQERPRPILGVKWAIQRSCKGFSNHDAWGFYNWHAEVVANLCQHYLDLKWSHPCGVAGKGFGVDMKQMESGAWVCDCDCEAEWGRILTTMRDGFRMIAEDEDTDDDFNIKPEAEEALDLFQRHYRSLWL